MSDPYLEMSLEDTRGEIVKFNNDPNAQRLKSRYGEKTYPEILGVSRRELSHSGFLAWVLDPTESHGIGDFGIRRLLEIVITSKLWNTDAAKQGLFDDLITGNFQVASSSVRREVNIGKAGRVDVLIELTFAIGQAIYPLRIVIENKVLSTEGIDQTGRYFQHFEGLADGFTNLYVYLTPLSSLDLEELSEPECENKNFIQINYQELVDSLLEPAMEQTAHAETKLMIGQYIQSLSQPSMDELENDFERGLIMAIGSKERELLEKFWAGNQKIIQAALYAISSDPNQDKEVRESVQEALSSIASSGKDRSTIMIRNEGADHARIRKSDIGYETVKLLESRGLIDDEVFRWLAEDTSCGFKLLKTKEDVRETEAQYRKYRVKDEPELVYANTGYYVARNWGIGNIDKFITKLESRFPGLEYVIETKP